MSTPPLYRRDIRDRANAATPGPWTADGTTVTTPDGRTLVYEVLLGDDDTRDEFPQARADAAFIAAARTDVPALLDEVRRLSRLVDDVLALHSPAPGWEEQWHDPDEAMRNGWPVCAGCKTDVSFNTLRGCPTRRVILGEPR